MHDKVALRVRALPLRRHSSAAVPGQGGKMPRGMASLGVLIGL